MVLNFALAGRSRIDTAFNRLDTIPAMPWGSCWAQCWRYRCPSYGADFTPGRAGIECEHVCLMKGLSLSVRSSHPRAPSMTSRRRVERALACAWRMHRVLILQIPIIAIIMLPWQIALVLCAPVASGYGSHPNMSAFVGTGIPLFFAVSGAAIIIAQHLIAFRMLGKLTPDFKPVRSLR